MLKVQTQKLPEEIVAPLTYREMLATGIGVLLLIFLVNGFLVEIENRFSPNLGDRLITKKWEILFRLEKPVEGLILGDSGGNQAVIPGMLKEKLKTDSVNLCTVGSLTLLNDVWMLEAYLARFGPPRYVLLVNDIYTWQRDLDKEIIGKIPLPWGFWERYEPSLSFNLKEKVLLGLMRYAPLYSTHESFSRLFTLPRKSFLRKFQVERDGFTRQEKPDPPDSSLCAKKVYLERLRGREFSLSEVNRRVLERMNRLAERHGFEIYLADSPVDRGLLREKEFRASFREARKTLSRLSARYPQIHYLSNLSNTFPENQIQNVDHLLFQGAQVYTERLIANLRGEPTFPGRPQDRKR